MSIERLPGVLPDTVLFREEHQGEAVFCACCPERPYMELTVPSHVYEISRVVFQITSHDQGFCDDDSAGAWSWFFAAVVNTSGHRRVARKDIAKNQQGNPHYHTHVAIWDKSKNHDQHTLLLLESIRPGDRIQIVPKASYPYWRNYVNGASIEICGSERVVEASEMPMNEGDNSRGQTSTDLYRTLDGELQQIRLLRLHPKSRNKKLSCRLETVSLKDNCYGPYESLSYCWGHRMSPKCLQIASEEQPDAWVSLPITTNLRQALKRLRREGNERVLWIDAICIDQSNKKERAQQVNLMRDIYLRATNVAVWLGPCPPKLQDVLGKVKLIEAEYKKACASNKHMPKVAGIHEHIGQNHKFLDWTPLLRFEYFKRVWVLQEVHNNPAVTVYCGPHVLSWALILRLNQCIIRTAGLPGPKPNQIMPKLFSSLFRTQMKHSPLSYEPKPKLNILKTFIEGLDLDASDPRDKLFALLSFVKETRDMPQLPEEVAPSYEKSTGSVFADFTRWWIKTHQSLRILSTVHASVGRTWQDLGSVVEFPYEDRASWSIWHDGCESWALNTLDRSPLCPKFRASGDTQVDIELVQQGDGTHSLSLLGRQVGAINDISSFPYYTFHANELQDDMASTIIGIYDILFDPLNSRGAWEFRIGDIGKPAEEAQRKVMIEDHFRAHEHFAKHTGGIECHHPSYMALDQGYVGLCPPTAKKGDIAVVFHGGNIPFILRTTAGTLAQEAGKTPYRLVGECYLHDFMHGRACSKTEDGLDMFREKMFDLI